MRAVVLFLGRHSVWMVPASVIGSMSAYWFISTEDASIAHVFFWFGAPVVAAVLAAGLVYAGDLKEQCDTDAKFWLSLLSVCLFLSMSAPGWLLWANAVLPPQEHFVLTGTVTAKEVTYFKHTPKPWVSITGYPVRIEISERAYSRLSIGDTFRQLRYRGPLGISYVWRADSLENEFSNPTLSVETAPSAREPAHP